MAIVLKPFSVKKKEGQVVAKEATLKVNVFEDHTPHSSSSLAWSFEML